MSAPDLLAEAAAIVAKRRRQYGPARPLFEQVAMRWSATLGVEVTPEQVVLCMIDVKLARLGHDPAHRDSAIDVAGYSSLLADVAAVSTRPQGKPMK